MSAAGPPPDPDSDVTPARTSAHELSRAEVRADELAHRRRRTTVVISAVFVALVAVTGLALGAIARSSGRQTAAPAAADVSATATTPAPLIAPTTAPTPTSPSTTTSPSSVSPTTRPSATSPTPRRTTTSTASPAPIPSTPAASSAPSSAASPSASTSPSAPASPYVALRSAPAASPERIVLASGTGGTPCAATGRGAGYGTYPGAACRSWQPVWGLLHHDRLSPGVHTVACQRDLRTANLVFKPGQTNTWWVWLPSDAGTWDWYPETALAQGAPDSPVSRVALCP